MVSSIATVAMDNRTAFGYPLAEQGGACVAATPAGACGPIPHTTQCKGNNTNRPAGDTALVMAPRRHGVLHRAFSSVSRPFTPSADTSFSHSATDSSDGPIILITFMSSLSLRLQATRLFLCRVNPELGTYQHRQQSSLNTLLDAKLFHSSSPCWAFALSRKRPERWPPLIPQD